MSTKAQIQSTIGSNLASGSNITAAEVRDSFYVNANSIVENIYPTVKTEDETTTQVFTKVASNVEYDFKIVKQGRSVIVNGTLKSSSGITADFLNSVNLFQITNTEFQTNSKYQVRATRRSDGSNARVELENNYFKLKESISTFEVLEISVTYFTTN